MVNAGEPGPAWATRAGLIDLPTEPPVVSGDLRAAVAERVNRYSWGYDERRADLLGDCFTDDAVWRGNIMGRTEVGPFEGRDAIVAYLTGFWPEQSDQRRHVFTNLVVASVETTRVTAFAYLMLMAARDARPGLETTGAYRFDLVAVGNVWRIGTLTAGFDAPF